MLWILMVLGAFTGCHNQSNQQGQSMTSVKSGQGVSKAETKARYWVKILNPQKGFIEVAIGGINDCVDPPTLAIFDPKKTLPLGVNLQSATVFNQQNILIGSVLYHRPGKIPQMEVRLFDPLVYEQIDAIRLVMGESKDKAKDPQRCENYKNRLRSILKPKVSQPHNDGEDDFLRATDPPSQNGNNRKKCCKPQCIELQ